MAFNVAIDGPAGAGKSTIAKSVAAELNFIYVDTGAMYRAIALYLIRNGISADDNAGISEKCKEAKVSIQYVDGKQVVLLNGEDVNPYIRTEEVGNMASASSTNPDVRAQLLDLQRALAANNDVIMDGRDIGTNILPNAQVKIYLTASTSMPISEVSKKTASSACFKGAISRFISRSSRSAISFSISLKSQSNPLATSSL